MEVELKFFQRHPLLKDGLNLLGFVMMVVFGTIILNTYIFRSYNVVGVSMENTLHGDDRIIVDRLSVTMAHFWGKPYVPERGKIIVFANGSSSGPLTCEADHNVRDQYIIKRVIAYPGERVVLRNGVFRVYNQAFPEGFDPDLATRIDENNGPKKQIDGEVDMVVPENELFVSGDNREETHSFDSRNGLGTVPYCRVIGPAVFRLWPFDKLKFF